MARRREVLLDTSYLIAFVDPNDRWYDKARALTREFASAQTTLVLTDAVLIELGNYFSRTRFRVAAGDLILSIRSDARWLPVPIEPDLILAAEARYRRFDDKNWSMTDCISMEVMERRRIREVATSDGGFAQAGFTVLMV